MKKPKIVFLLEALSTFERKNFEGVLKNKKRKQLFQLYKIVLSEMKKDSVSQERIFELLYKTPYDKSKNYLLRNELRLLSNELKTFLARQTMEEKLKTEPNVQTLLYLQALLGKTDIDFFLTECQKAFESAEKNNDFTNASQILSLSIRAFIQQSKPTYESYLGLLEKLEKNDHVTTQAFLENWIDVQKFKAFTLKSLNAMHPSKREISFPNHLKLDWKNEDENAPYFQYQMLWTKSYTLEGLEKIKTLQAAETYISQIKKTGFSNASEFAKVNASIALDYFLLGKYQLSLLHHEKVLLQKKQLSNNDLAVYLFNYISTLLRIDNFELALQLILENEKLLLQQERLQDRFLNIKAMCHLLLNQIDAAEACLPSHRKEGGMYNYFYFRVVQSMVFFAREEVDLAINELQNLEYSLHYNQLKNSGFKGLTNYLQKFYKLQRDKHFINNFFQEKEKLRLEIEAMDDQQAKFQYLLPYKWLMRMMNGE